MCTEKHVLLKYRFENGLLMGLSLRTWVEKTAHGVHTDSQVKKKFRTQRSIKKVLLIVCDTEGLINTDFHEKKVLL